MKIILILFLSISCFADLTQAKKDEIVDELITSIEEFYFRKQVEETLIQVYRNGESIEEMRAILKGMTTTYIPNTALDLPTVKINTVRSNGQILLDAVDKVGALIRAVSLEFLQEFNFHALKINEILDAADAANNLADFKSRMALIQDYPQRTPTQLRNQIKSRLNNGEADS